MFVPVPHRLPLVFELDAVSMGLAGKVEGALIANTAEEHFEASRVVDDPEHLQVAVFDVFLGTSGCEVQRQPELAAGDQYLPHEITGEELGLVDERHHRCRLNAARAHAPVGRLKTRAEK